ncbi:MAG: 3,4-dihydroxy-2-butanone-4-phosphate synthase [Jatrophihabitans sp.]
MTIDTDPVAAALGDLARGQMIVVIDDEDRENEGDLIMAAEFATPSAVAFLVRHTSGLLCVSLPEETADALGLPHMVTGGGDDVRGTAFTVTCDFASLTGTGISATDRATTVRALAAPATRAADLTRPGHVMPLRARRGGVLTRRGHTEAAGDLCRLAGISPVGVLCEIVNDDGSMARGAQLRRFADTHRLTMISVADLVTYRRRTESHVHRATAARIPTRYGQFTAIAYSDTGETNAPADATEHVALVLGDVTKPGRPVLAHVHFECVTGDIFGSRRCECGEQLQQAMQVIGHEGRGVVVYLRGHRGRGIGLAVKLRSHALHDTGFDVVDANQCADAHDCIAAAHILRDLQIGAVQLLTDNPDEHRQLVDLEPTEQLAAAALAG